MNVFPLPSFRQIVEELSTFSINYADQNAPRDLKPYATIKLRSNVGTDNSELFAQDADDNREVEENNAVMLELNFYGPGAISEATRVRNKLMFENTTDALFANNISVISRGQVTNLTALLNNSQYEQRAMFEIKAGWRSAEIENVGRIETVEIAGIIRNGYESEPPVMTTANVQLEIAFE